jgi:hypothetical protein
MLPDIVPAGNEKRQAGTGYSYPVIRCQKDNRKAGGGEREPALALNGAVNKECSPQIPNR